MLCNTKDDKRKDMDITEKQWTEMLNITFEGIKRKLNSARILVDHDKEISAGLYTFALEEFGKLLLLKDSVRVANNTKER
jgi:hypothetical protein